jgi:hypothetical protein
VSYHQNDKPTERAKRKDGSKKLILLIEDDEACAEKEARTAQKLLSVRLFSSFVYQQLPKEAK